MSGFHISIVAEEITKIELPFIGPTSITNSMFTGWIVTLVVSLILLSIVSTLKKKPDWAQNLYESIYLFIYGMVKDIIGTKLTEKLFPLFLTIFFFILFGSWAGLLPGVGTLGFIQEEHGKEVAVPLFRAVTADINTAIALAIIAFLVIEYYGFKENGAGYLKKFFNFSSPVNFIVGFFELISELMRLITFSFRLFGNIFAGEVILTVMLSLAAFFVLPFLAFEVFVGVIQAFVFVMLTAAFINQNVEKVEHH